MTIQEKAYERRWWILVVLCLSLVVITLDNTILNVALPTLVEKLDASNSQLQWIVDGYTLVFAGLLFTAGTLAALTLIAGCERPPVESVQRGYRGTGMDQVYNPRTVARQVSMNTVPATTPIPGRASKDSSSWRQPGCRGSSPSPSDSRASGKAVAGGSG